MAKQLTSAVDLGFSQKLVEEAAANLLKTQAAEVKAVMAREQAEEVYENCRRGLKAAFDTVASTTKVVI
jgi:hypothetical protein